MTLAVLLAALALVLSALRLGGLRVLLRWLLPLLALLATLRGGLTVACAAGVSVLAWQAGLARYLGRRRLQRLRIAAEEPIQAMFEQASLYGSAELCALAALPACSGELKVIWQQALADWLRGGTSEAAFAAIGHQYDIPLLVRLARALSLSRHTGAPLDHHLAVLLEDTSEDRREVSSLEGETLPYYVVTVAMASLLLLLGLALAARGADPLPWVLVITLLTGGVVPLVSASLLP